MSNLPPGVTESMIPGNRPEDFEFDALCDALLDVIANFQLCHLGKEGVLEALRAVLAEVESGEVDLQFAPGPEFPEEDEQDETDPAAKDPSPCLT